MDFLIVFVVEEKYSRKRQGQQLPMDACSDKDGRQEFLSHNIEDFVIIKYQKQDKEGTENG